MCKAVEEYGEERALITKVELIQNLMDTMKISAQQAMDAMKISKEEQSVLKPMFK